MCRSSRFLSVVVAATLISAALSRPASAQQPAPPAGLAPYRAPVIAQVQPAGGGLTSGTVPLDKPVVVFRFAAGEATDPVDVRSLLVAVDGADRTALFQTTAAEAWGPLADAADIESGRFTVGVHRVTARICSSHGACTTSETQLLVQPPPVTPAALPNAAAASRTRRTLGLLLSATRRLLTP